MADQLETGHLPGAVISFVQDGRIILAKGYGHADIDEARPVDPGRTLFRVASVSKLFVGTAVMQLVERGDLDLDADVNTYLSEFTIPDTFAEPITLRHLLTHSAGVEERVIGVDPDLPEDIVLPLAQLLQDLFPARVRPPGRVASYSNWGVTLAGHIVERVSGLSFAEYVDRNILAPLQMARSTYLEPVPAPLADHLATGYHYEDGAYVAQPFEFTSEHGPAAALSSTAIDMAHFMIAHLQRGRFGNTRILSADSADAMQRRQFGHPASLPSMALSFGVMDRDGRQLLQHSGATFVFHANLALLPGEGVGVFLAFNAPGEAGAEILEAFLDRYYPTPEPAAVRPPADFADRSGRYVGAYRDTRLAFTRLEKAMRFNELWVHATDRNTLFLGDLLSDPGNPDEGVEYIEIGPNLFRQAEGDVLVAFGEDDSGRINALLLGSSVNSFARIPWYETVHVLVLVAIVSLVVFAAAGARGIWLAVRHRRRGVVQPRWVRAAAGVKIALCATNAVFIVGFAAMVVTMTDYFRYPPGMSAILALPVASVVLTAIAAGLSLLAYVRRSGTRLGHMNGVVVTLTSAVLLWFLAEWNILGWQY